MVRGAQAADSRQQYTQEDRERIIHVERDVQHLATDFAEMKEVMKELSVASRDQRFTIDGILKGMDKAEQFMLEVGKHDARLTALETKVNAFDAERKEAVEQRNIIKADVDAINVWKDRAWFLGKIGYTVLTTPILIYLGFQLFTFLQNAPK